MITTLSLAFVFSRTASGRLDPIGDFAASADAKKVVFASGSTKFVVAQLKYRDLESGESFEVSIGVDGKAADRSCDNVAISPSGDTVAFTSTATNLIPNGTKQDRVYVWDRATRKLRVVSDGLLNEVVNARKHDMSVSDGGRTVMFITGTINGVPARIWIAEAGKKVATLSSRLGLESPKKDDLRASICGDGKSFYAVVQDGRYNLNRNMFSPMLVAGNLEKGIVTRMPLMYPYHSLGALAVSANGMTMAYNDCEVQGKLVNVVTWVFQSGHSKGWERAVEHAEKNLTHYPWLLALSGDGNLIIYQSSRNKVETSDQVVLRNWKTGHWENVSVDNTGRAGDIDAGGDAFQLKAFSSNADGSTVLFTGRSLYGLSFPETHAIPHLLCRDTVNQKTSEIR